MSQSYKVFIGASVFVFENEAKNEAVFNIKLISPSKQEILGLITECEADSQSIQILGDTPENWGNFTSHFKIIEAAGGFVQNTEGKWLFIHRNGVWDLPKGKLEKGETIEKCAVREVAEECGIEEPTIVKMLTATYHIYTLKGQRILKPTYWYLMKSFDNSELFPQTREGITEVSWVSSDEARLLANDSFGSIKQVVTEGL